MLTLVAKVKKRRKHATMLFTTILNRVLKFKSFVFKNAKFGKMRKGQPTIEVEVVSRKGSKAICSGCEKPRPGYDTLPARYFEHIPFWGFLIFLVYRRRRVDCPQSVSTRFYGIGGTSISLKRDGKS